MRFGRLFTYALLAVGLIVGGCSLRQSSEPVTDKLITDLSGFSQDSTLLAGEWEWQRTVCCYGNLSVETPENTGETSTLVVTPKDTVKVYVNDTLDQREGLSEYLGRARWGGTGDSLVVSRAYRDGPQSVYVREGNGSD